MSEINVTEINVDNVDIGTKIVFPDETTQTTAPVIYVGTIDHVRVAAIETPVTHAGASETSEAPTGWTMLSAHDAVALDASTTYVLEWNVNLIESDGGAAGKMEGDAEFKTSAGVNAGIAMYRANVYEQTSGSSGTSEQHPHDIGFIHGFTTNSTGGDYWFQFDSNHLATYYRWKVHDFTLKIFKCNDYAGGATFTQSE